MSIDKKVISKKSAVKLAVVSTLLVGALASHIGYHLRTKPTTNMFDTVSKYITTLTDAVGLKHYTTMYERK